MNDRDSLFPHALFLQMLDERDNVRVRPWYDRRKSNNGGDEKMPPTQILLIASSYKYTQEYNNKLDAKMTADDGMMQLCYYCPHPQMSSAGTGMRKGRLNLAPLLFGELVACEEMAEFIEELKASPQFENYDPQYAQKLVERMTLKEETEREIERLEREAHDHARDNPDFLPPPGGGGVGSVRFMLNAVRQAREDIAIEQRAKKSATKTRAAAAGQAPAPV